MWCSVLGGAAVARARADGDGGGSVRGQQCGDPALVQVHCWSRVKQQQWLCQRNHVELPCCPYDACYVVVAAAAYYPGTEAAVVEYCCYTRQRDIIFFPARPLPRAACCSGESMGPQSDLEIILVNKQYLNVSCVMALPLPLLPECGSKEHRLGSDVVWWCMYHKIWAWAQQQQQQSLSCWLLLLILLLLLQTAAYFTTPVEAVKVRGTQHHNNRRYRPWI